MRAHFMCFIYPAGSHLGQPKPYRARRRGILGMANLLWVQFPAAMAFDGAGMTRFVSRFAGECLARTKKKLQSTNWCTSGWR